jgi:uncharacterized DUF497 family protein
MRIEFDPVKSQKNADERQLPFDLVDGFDWDAAMVVEDTRKAYPERRFEAVGPVGERLHVVVLAAIADGLRVISFRKANAREEKRYEKNRRA